MLMSSLEAGFANKESTVSLTVFAKDQNGNGGTEQWRVVCSAPA